MANAVFQTGDWVQHFDGRIGKVVEGDQMVIRPHQAPYFAATVLWTGTHQPTRVRIEKLNKINK